jgi:hypothetical protein
MSMTFWINIRDENNHRYSNEQDHSAVFDLSEQIDRIATSLGVEKISSFYDSTEILCGYIEMKETQESDMKENLNNGEKWFKPQEGMTTINAILEHIRQNPTAIQLMNDCRWSVDDILNELEDCKSELLKVVSQQSSFHFCILD